MLSQIVNIIKKSNGKGLSDGARYDTTFYSPILNNEINVTIPIHFSNSSYSKNIRQ